MRYPPLCGRSIRKKKDRKDKRIVTLKEEKIIR